MKAFKAIGQTFRVSIKSFLLFEACLLGGAAFGGIMETLIYTFSGDSVLGLAFMFAAMALVIIVMFGSVFGGYGDFAMAVYFQRSRKFYLFTKYIYYVAEYGLAALLLFGIYTIESSFVRLDSEVIMEMGNMVPVAIAGVLVVPLIVILFSALYAKFERKFFWVMWVLWMVIFAGGPRVLTAMHEHPESAVAKVGFFLENAISAGTIESFIAVIVIAIIAIAANIMIYRSVDVRD